MMRWKLVDCDGLSKTSLNEKRADFSALFLSGIRIPLPDQQQERYPLQQR